MADQGHGMFLLSIYYPTYQAYQVRSDYSLQSSPLNSNADSSFVGLYALWRQYNNKKRELCGDLKKTSVFEAPCTLDATCEATRNNGARSHFVACCVMRCSLPAVWTVLLLQQDLPHPSLLRFSRRIWCAWVPNCTPLTVHSRQTTPLFGSQSSPRNSNLIIPRILRVVQLFVLCRSFALWNMFRNIQVQVPPTLSEYG